MISKKILYIEIAPPLGLFRYIVHFEHYLTEIFKIIKFSSLLSKVWVFVRIQNKFQAFCIFLGIKISISKKVMKVKKLPICPTFLDNVFSAGTDDLWRIYNLHNILRVEVAWIILFGHPHTQQQWHPGGLGWGHAPWDTGVHQYKNHNKYLYVIYVFFTWFLANLIRKMNK